MSEFYTHADHQGQMYLAGPLFSESEREFNQHLKALLGRSFQVYLPQEDGRLLVQMIKEGMSPTVAGRHIFDADLSAIQRADVFLIVLDGRCIDEGASFELGVAYALGKRCFGLQTDVRRLLPCGNNPMIQQALIHVFKSVSELEEWIMNQGFFLESLKGDANFRTGCEVESRIGAATSTD